MSARLHTLLVGMLVGTLSGCLSISSTSINPVTSAVCLRGEYRALPANGQAVTPEALGIIRSIIESRIDWYGVSGPIVQRQGGDRIVVDILGVTYEQDVRQLIGSTGQLDFVEVPLPRNDDVIEGLPIPPDLAIFLSGDQIDSATPGFTQTGGPAVDFTLRAYGSQIFAQYTTQHVNERFAIVLDGMVISAPNIQTPISDGRGQISGSLQTQADVNRLVTVLRYGALPNAIEEVSFSKTSCP